MFPIAAENPWFGSNSFLVVVVFAAKIELENFFGPKTSAAACRRKNTFFGSHELNSAKTQLHHRNLSTRTSKFALV
jgi:hypothetical protein